MISKQVKQLQLKPTRLLAHKTSKSTMLIMLVLQAFQISYDYLRVQELDTAGFMGYQDCLLSILVSQLGSPNNYNALCECITHWITYQEQYSQFYNLPRDIDYCKHIIYWLTYLAQQNVVAQKYVTLTYMG